MGHNMQWGPIFAALRRNRVGAVLIALQIAVTLAVLCNALFIIQARTAASRTPSGVRDEASVFAISNRWTGQGVDLAARERTDLAALRALPQVRDAIVSVGHPLGGGGFSQLITSHPDRPGSGMGVTVYFTDEHGLDTLGLRLIAGRNFHSDEIVDRHGIADPASSLEGVIVTQALANLLEPGGNVLGRTITMTPDGTRAPIIGIVASVLSAPRLADSAYAYWSILVPYFWSNAQVFYIVRAQTGQVSAAMKASRAKLYEISHQRVITSMQTLSDARRDAFRGTRALALIMSVICGILLAVTAFGILGLTTYWVVQRKRQIGVRRALGATRSSILRYFQAENLLIAGGGSIIGVALGVAANIWGLQGIALARLPPLYLIVGFVAMLILGQLAVLWPALRAASVPPAVVTRNL